MVLLKVFKALVFKNSNKNSRKEYSCNTMTFGFVLQLNTKILNYFELFPSKTESDLVYGGTFVK
ncbi:hypothetical protein FBFR_11840 [Flavobacterium fryxellicola]|uniref:Uncharacterized protein n=1 Tax=Flavobacterium fryxellicola TaxID=249352 RepID=A0A167WCA8_9FLAO|nr:hypothetical protein FBFR_11840 [Flavobacterium fryxellicola]